jgi:hypothetical protein
MLAWCPPDVTVMAGADMRAVTNITFRSLTALIGIACFINATHAQKAPESGGASGSVISIGDRQIRILLPAGHCPLDRNTPSDKKIFDNIETTSGGANRVYQLSTSCTELNAWRTGLQPLLTDYVMVGSVVAEASMDFRGRETQKTGSLCAVGRTQGGQITEAAYETVLKNASDKAKYQGMAFLGVLGEDTNGCYVGSLITILSPVGPKLQAFVFSALVLNGRTVDLYHYSDKTGPADIARLLSASKAAAKAHVDATGNR